MVNIADGASCKTRLVLQLAMQFLALRAAKLAFLEVVVSKLKFCNYFDSKWIADIQANIYTNYVKKFVVSFEKSGNAYVGKIKDMPTELMSKWAEKPDGERYLIRRGTSACSLGGRFRAVEEAERVFIRALAETSVEKKMRKYSGENK